MSDFEYKLQRWFLGILVLMTIALAAMNYLYKVLPEKTARARAAEAQAKAQPVTNATAATSASSPTAANAGTAESAPQPDPPPRKVDIEELALTLPDGRILGFEKPARPRNRAENWSSSEIINPWILETETLERSEFPPIPSQRNNFIPLLLADGRLALIGGTTPRDVVALETKCADCPDEYVLFGDATPSKTTDVLDFETGTWSSGPISSLTTDSAIALRDGGVFKVTLERVPVIDQLATNLFVEISDNKFTRWQHASDVHIGAYLRHADVFESRTGVVVLFANRTRSHAFHWTERGKLKPWLEGENWTRAERLDEGHLQLTQVIDGTPPHSTTRIVELP